MLFSLTFLLNSLSSLILPICFFAIAEGNALSWPLLDPKTPGENGLLVESFLMLSNHTFKRMKGCLIFNSRNGSLRTSARAIISFREERRKRALPAKPEFYGMFCRVEFWRCRCWRYIYEEGRRSMRRNILLKLIKDINYNSPY